MKFVAQIFATLLLLQIASCKLTKKSKNKVEVTNDHISNVFNSLAMQFNLIAEYQDNVFDVLKQMESQENALKMFIAAATGKTDGDVEKIRLDSFLDGVDVEQCFNEYHNADIFLHMRLNTSVLTVKKEIWQEITKNFVDFETNLGELYGRAKETHRDVHECDHSDDDCFEDIWDEFSEIHELVLKEHKTIRTRGVLMKLSVLDSLNKWNQMTKNYVNAISYDDDSFFNDFKECVHNETTTHDSAKKTFSIHQEDDEITIREDL